MLTLLFSSMVMAGGPAPDTGDGVPAEGAEQRPFSVAPYSISIWEMEGIEMSLFGNGEGAITLFNDTGFPQDFTLSINSTNADGVFTFNTEGNPNVYGAHGESDGVMTGQSIDVSLDWWGFTTIDIDFEPPQATADSWGELGTASTSLVISSLTHDVTGDIRLNAIYEIPYEESMPDDTGVDHPTP